MTHIELQYDPETNTWAGRSVDKPGIISQNDTAAEALADLFAFEEDWDYWVEYFDSKRGEE